MYDSASCGLVDFEVDMIASKQSFSSKDGDMQCLGAPLLPENTPVQASLFQLDVPVGLIAVCLICTCNALLFCLNFWSKCMSSVCVEKKQLYCRS